MASRIDLDVTRHRRGGEGIDHHHRLPGAVDPSRQRTVDPICGLHLRARVAAGHPRLVLPVRLRLGRCHVLRPVLRARLRVPEDGRRRRRDGERLGDHLVQALHAEHRPPQRGRDSHRRRRLDQPMTRHRVAAKLRPEGALGVRDGPGRGDQHPPFRDPLDREAARAQEALHELHGRRPGREPRPELARR